MRKLKSFFCILCGLVIGVLSHTTKAQTPADTIAAFHRALEQSIVLLRNENSLIPLQRLESVRIAYYDLNGEQGSPLEKTLAKYAQVATPELPDGLSAAEAILWAEQQARQYDVCIWGIRDGAPEEALPAYLRYQFLLHSLLERKPGIVVSFGTGRAYQFFHWITKAQALIHSQAQGAWAESLSAQAIFGAVSLLGKLAYDLSPDFPTGAGLNSAGGLRLRYGPPAIAGMDENLLRDSIAAIVQQGIAAGAFPGAQVLVARRGVVVYHEAFGHHTYDGLQPVTTDDIYDLASVTKISSALPAIMQLYGQGRLNLDAPLSQYWPALKKSNKASLTARTVLAHHARLMAWIPFWRATLKGNAQYPWEKGWQPNLRNTGAFKPRTFAAQRSKAFPVLVTDSLWLHKKYKDHILGAIERSPLNEKPGFVYSDLSFYWWPEILPRLTKTDFETWLKREFYHPLGAFTLTYNPLRYFPKSRIVPTERDTFFRMTLLHGRVHDEGAAMLGGVSGHAGLFGSANDLAKLLQMYLNGGEYGGRRFIPVAALEEFTRCAYCSEGNHRALGFDRPMASYDPSRALYARSASERSFGHSGYTGTFVWADPDNEGLLFIFLSNRVYPTRDNRLLTDLRIRPRIHQVLYEAVLTKG